MKSTVPAQASRCGPIGAKATFLTIIISSVFISGITVSWSFRKNILFMAAKVKQPRLNPHRNKMIQCIRPLAMGNASEGLGSVLRRNQLAIFLADVYGANLAWDSMPSSHRYHTNEFFSECETATDDCRLRQSSMVLPKCSRGDCDCLFRGVSDYVIPKENICTVLGVQNERLMTQEYSGCMKNVLTRYFVRPEVPVVPDYDVIHYRMGDLKKKKGTKSPLDVELYYTLEAMCKLSERDIYVLTEGNPSIPFVSCFDRIVMASDTSMIDVFSIIRYAKAISVGSSSFSIAMAEVAEPTEVITLHRTLGLFEWIDSPKWTVIMEYGEHFHFNSKKMMIDTLLTGKDYRSRTYRRESWFNATGFHMKVVQRKYNETTFWTSI